MEKTDIRFSKIGIRADIIVVQILGALDTVAAYSFREDIEKQIADGCYSYIIDLEHLDYISSAGIGVFPALAHEIRGHNGGIIFINVSDKTLKLFNMVGLTTIFGVRNTLEEAVKEFDPGASQYSD